MPPTGLFPRGGPRPTTSRAEEVLYRALASGLPDGWTAWHSLRLRTGDNVEGEGDFVLAVPDRGVLVLEVKGGRVEVRNGVWFQNDRRMDPDPRTQGHEYGRKLRRRLEAVVGERTPWIAVATAFPDVAFASGPTQDDVRGATLGAQDLPYLREALPARADYLFAGKRAAYGTGWVDALHALWGETWVPRLSLGARARLRDDELVALDRDQIVVLDRLADNDRVLVTGRPRTGKTILAAELYARRARASKRTAYLCFTAALAAELRPAAWRRPGARETSTPTASKTRTASIYATRTSSF